MRFQCGERILNPDITRLIVAGWTGRNRADVDHHIAELAEIGVPAPSSVPLFYRVSQSLLTQAPMIEVLGNETSGEAEPFLLRHQGKLMLGLASDHTDRGLEAQSVAASKQACAKPVSTELWAVSDLTSDIDTLELSCHIKEDGDWTLYQHGALSRILPLSALDAAASLADGDAMLCGTLPAIGPVRHAGAYRLSLTDPASGQALRLDYSVTTLPVIT